MRPLIFLELRQFVNSVKAVTRSPKRLIPAIIIAAWVLSVAVMDALAMFHVERPFLPPGFVYQPPSDTAPIWAGVFILLTITAGGVIYTALAEGLLVFAPAHIDFLFPTPVSRRHVLMFKLLRDYLRYAGYAGMLFAVIGSPLYHVMNVEVYPDIFISWLGSVLLIISVMNITHTLNIIVTAGTQRLRVAKFIVQILAFGLVIILLTTFVINLAWTSDPFASAVGSVGSSVVKTILAPMGWATDAILVPLRGVVDEGQELVGLFLIAAISTLILLGRHEDIYEPSLAISTRMARVRRALKHGNTAAARIEAVGWHGRSKFEAPPIPPFGRGAAAILWKNVVMRVRTSPKTLVMMILLPIAISAIIGSAVHPPQIRGAVPLFMPYIAWVLALVGQQEMRGELRQADMIKAMPLSPFRVMAAQFFYEWMPIALVIVVSTLSLRHFVPDAEPDLLILSAIVSLTFGFACVAAVSIPVLIYPDARDKMQDVITHAISFVFASAAIVPSAVILIIKQSTGLGSVAAAAMIVVLNAVIAATATLIAGLVFSRFDPTS